MDAPPDTLTETAARAARLARFYRELYGGTVPAGPDEIPFHNDAAFARAEGLLDTIVDQAAMVGILPPYHRDACRLPFVAAEDEAELILRQKRIVRAMLHLGVDFDDPPRFQIITDRRRGPFACELAKGFYWEGFQTCISFDNASDDATLEEIQAIQPDFVVLVARRNLRHRLAPPTTWIVEHCGGPMVDDRDFPALLYTDGVDLIGSRAAGEERFDVDADQLLIEDDPATGLSHVTKRQFTCFPLVRYGLGVKVTTAGMNTDPS